MSLDLIGLGYLGIGVVAAVVVSALVRRPSATDAVLLVGMWPVWAPMLLAQRHAHGDHERELLSALARAQRSPLAQVLPDAETARLLGARLREATTRLAELDVVLGRRDFDPAAVDVHAKQLAARGATAAAATAQLRVRTLGQLRTLRERYRSELDEVNELIAQLVTQAELVRLQPSIAQSSGELVRELVSRVEGLGELLAYETTLASETTELEYKAAADR